MSGAHCVEFELACATLNDLLIRVIRFQAMANKRRLWGGRIAFVIKTAPHEEQVCLLPLSIVQAFKVLKRKDGHLPHNGLHVLPITVRRGDELLIREIRRNRLRIEAFELRVMPADQNEREFSLRSLAYEQNLSIDFLS